MVDLVIGRDDLSGADIAALLETHLRHAAHHTPAGSGHALDLNKLRRPELTFYTARTADALLGCIALMQLDDTTGEIKSMHTAAAHRGKGIACALLSHVIGVARSRHYSALVLETGDNDGFAAARRVYERAGFRHTPPFGPYIDDPFSYCMRLALDV